jgi:DNA invertase Pin-like site-specific DNA recombinase
MREKMTRSPQAVPRREPWFWSYVRWSSNPQEWGDSERRQDEAAINCAKKPNVPLVDRYRDEGTSAWTGANATNGDLRRFIEDIGTGENHPMPGDFLGIENFDRLSRMERIDSIPLMREIIDKGISIVPTMMSIPINRRTIKEGLDPLGDHRSVSRAHAITTLRLQGDDAVLPDDR